MVEQQRHDFPVAQVSVDAEQGGVAQDVGAAVHVGAARYQQPGHLRKRGRGGGVIISTSGLLVCGSVFLTYLDVGGVEVAQRGEGGAQLLCAVREPQPLQDGGGDPQLLTQALETREDT